MRVVIFGATGLLGKSLVGEWSRLSVGDVVSALGSKDADIRDEKQVSAAIAGAKPDWVVLAAAYTDVDGCESNRELAFEVNCQGAINVAQAALAHGARLLTLSTDYVFDGTKRTPYEVDDARAPRGVYGHSKAAAEEELTRIMPEACIARTAWLFGVGGKCFPDTILKLAATRSSLDVVDDQRGSPTYVVDLARAIIQLCHAGAKGIVHVTNREECTWFDFAREILAAVGSNTVVRPTTSEKFVRPAERPKYSVLSPASLAKYSITLPPWRDAMNRYLRERNAHD
jgi:dTDP-4-dehydrorhamnose reductase